MRTIVSHLALFLEAKTQEVVTQSLFLKPYAGWDFASNLQISSLLFHVPQIARIYTDFVLFGIESAWYLFSKTYLQ